MSLAPHFYTRPSRLIGQKPQLASLKAFGTDGELALENALSAAFPCAQHLRCFLHFRGNIERKLEKLAIPGVIAPEIVKDVSKSFTSVTENRVGLEELKLFISLTSVQGSGMCRALGMYPTCVWKRSQPTCTIWNYVPTINHSFKRLKPARVATKVHY